MYSRRGAGARCRGTAVGTGLNTRIGFAEKVRGRVEAAGRIELDDAQADELWSTKKTFVLLMPPTMVLALIPMGARSKSAFLSGWFFMGVMYVVTQGVAEYGLRPAAKDVLKVVGKTIAGLAGLGACLGFAY